MNSLLQSGPKQSQNFNFFEGVHVILMNYFQFLHIQEKFKRKWKEFNRKWKEFDRKWKEFNGKCKEFHGNWMDFNRNWKEFLDTWLNSSIFDWIPWYLIEFLDIFPNLIEFLDLTAVKSYCPEPKILRATAPPLKILGSGQYELTAVRSRNSIKLTEIYLRMVHWRFKRSKH